MYIFTTYPNARKWLPDGKIVLCWHKVLDNGNYDYDDAIRVFQLHKKELGIERSDADISEIVNVEGIEAMNAYMDLGLVEHFCLNQWQGGWDLIERKGKGDLTWVNTQVTEENTSRSGPAR